MNDCIFCKIIKGEIPSKKVYEDDSVCAFHDINPNAPVHVLVVPKTHIPSMNAVDESNIDAVSKVLLAIPKVASTLGLSNGYRVINNCGEDGGQTVPHIHFHILGGRKLSVKLN
ncbi:MAG TPA: histidine triad nucleotide-binding protein [Bacillota bacterium]|nr:histidine triad nucleotide-binding protein [Bacillota bacterium]HOK68592.1 histidine triad nucleotide-binding protein [Bacillota bacterium]HPP84804.1 histidine triad nucleotide-binding protein [Bacillota bacterium]